MVTDVIPLSSKPRFEILDGLRGVAAMIVVAFHLFETYSAGPSDQILNHGYLAVDFFFVLSGFVIGYAYDDRWERMTTWDFFKRRLIRLQPMVVLGTLIGGFWFYFSAAPGFELVMQTPWWKLLLIMVLGCIVFPTPPSMDIRGWKEINSLNGAQWSLLWEYVANILYAVFVRRFSTAMLGIFVLLSAFLTVDLALNLDVTGLLAVREYARYTSVSAVCCIHSSAVCSCTGLANAASTCVMAVCCGARLPLPLHWWCHISEVWNTNGSTDSIARW